MPAGELVVKRRLADAAMMEMRLNERKQQKHNQKKAVRRDYTANAPEHVPKKAFLWTYRGNVYPKRRFWVHVGMAGVDGIKPPPADLESAVLSLN